MTERERDDLLLEIRDMLAEHGERLVEHGERLVEHGERLAEHGERLERIEQDHGEKLERLLAIGQGQAAARVTTDERLAVLERRVSDLERKAG